jgi:hypothetical protein
MRFLIGILLGCLLSTGSAQSAIENSTSQNGRPSSMPLVIGKMHAPKMDGKVDIAEWSSAGVIRSFADNSTGKAPKAATRAYVGYDDTCLYIAVVCDEPMMNKAVQKVFADRDREVWENECAEIYLNPSGDKISYFHFITDILGQKYDAIGADPYGYNPDWKTAAFKGDKYWSVEVAIPFSSLNTHTPQPGQAWYALIGRERQAVPELSASQPTFGAFDSIGRYGEWVFGSLKMNLNDQADKLQQTTKDWPARMSADTAAWRKSVQAFQARLSGMDESAVRSAYPKLAADLEGLQKAARPLRLKAIRIAAGGKSILVSRAYPYQPFAGGQIAAGEQAGPVNLTLLQDEWADLAFNISNLSDSTVTLRFTTRQGSPQSDFAPLGLRGLDTLWQQAFAIAAGDGEKVYDAIVPIPAGTIEIPAGTTSQVWLSVHAPQDAPADTEGQIVIEPVDGSAIDPMRLPIKVSTLPVNLIANDPLNCFTWDALLFPPNQYPKLARANYRDLKAHGITMLMISSLRDLPWVKANADGSITEPMDFTKVDNLLTASHGIIDKYYITLDIWETTWIHKELFGLDWNDPAYEKAFKNWWRIVLNHLKSRGLTDDSFIVNPVDECSDQRFVTLAHWVKDVDPNVRIVIDSHGGTILRETHNPKDMADIWMPHYTQFSDPVYKQNVQIMRDAKMPLWVYYYSESGNEKRMDPTSRYLSKFWWAYSNGITGVCYWTAQLYGDPWYRKAYSGEYDTSLSYPTESGVVPSRRWQAWRQGWQDYCLLALVKNRLQQAGDQSGLSELNKKVEETVANGIDPVKTDEVRAWLKQKLATAR